MEASTFLPEGSPQIPKFEIWTVYEGEEVFHRLILDGQDMGTVDWETSKDGLEGYIDGLDAEDELSVRGIRDAAWIGIAACMQSLYPSVRSIEHLDGVISITQDL